MFAGRPDPIALHWHRVRATRAGEKENSMLIKSKTSRRILLPFDSGSGMGKLLRLAEE